MSFAKTRILAILPLLLSIVTSSPMNVVYRVPATASSVASFPACGGQCLPTRANDGHPSDNFNSGTCMHTNFEYRPWVSFDMRETKGVRTIVLINRQDCCTDQLTNFVMFATNSTNPADYSDRSKIQLCQPQNDFLTKN